MIIRQRKAHLAIWLVLLLALPAAFLLATQDKQVRQLLEPPKETTLPSWDQIENLRRNNNYGEDEVFVIIRPRISGVGELVIVQEKPVEAPGVGVFISWDDELTNMMYLGPLRSRSLEKYEIPELENPFFRRVVLYSFIEDRPVEVIRPIF